MIRLPRRTRNSISAGWLLAVVGTSAGAAPTAPCTVEHATGSSPYIATYIFFK